MTASPACRTVARRLADLSTSLAGTLPIDAARLNALDAFCKRFEQLATMLGELVFRSLATVGEDGHKPLSRRDLRALMARYGVLDDPDGFARVLDVRNRLAHVYPDDAERQVAILNEAYGLAPQLLAVFDRALAFVAAKGWADVRGIEPINRP